MKRNLVFNTLVAQEKINDGCKQSELFDYIISLGFKKIEVRREYFQDINMEMKEIGKLAKDKNLDILYSVPDVIFLNGGNFNKSISDYLKEAEEMNASFIKLTIGDYKNKTQLKELEFINNKNINFTVENDQTNLSGKTHNILKFLKDVKSRKININYTFDLGNFAYVNENEEEAAKILNQFVSYIHLKNVKKQHGDLLATSLEKGTINWKKVLDILPKNVPIAIEYPSNNVEEILEDKKMIEES
ncbi:sugar phosphate isomerase/epimerase family protein [Mammaliicoccus lentus]|uniref:sugar phosphate isomerase/epimerase family protein n=1 Tax=Mammaliicoccus lentus TaxID=42858 RepID=UPI003F56A01C